MRTRPHRVSREERACKFQMKTDPEFRKGLRAGCESLNGNDFE